MSGTNIVVELGRVVKDAELVSLGQNGNSFVVKFAIAVNEDVKKGDSYEQRPNYFNVDFFGNYAKAICSSLTQGREVLVSGRLRQDRWTTPEGKTASNILIKASDVTVLREPKKNQAPEARSPETQPPVTHQEYIPGPEDNPFVD